MNEFYKWNGKPRQGESFALIPNTMYLQGVIES